MALKLLDDHVVIPFNVLTFYDYARVISVFFLRVLHILHNYIFVLPNLRHSRPFYVS